MFEISTPVIVVASSYTKKTSPRVGSLAFVVERVGMSNLNNGYIKVPTKMVFFKYGFEKKTRSEIRYQNIVVPNYNIIQKSVAYPSKEVFKYVTRRGLKNHNKSIMVAPLNKPLEINQAIFPAFLHSLSEKAALQMMLDAIRYKNRNNDGWPILLDAKLKQMFGPDFLLFKCLFTEKTPHAMILYIEKQLRLSGGLKFLQYLSVVQCFKSLLLIQASSKTLILNRNGYASFLFLNNLEELITRFNSKKKVKVTKKYIDLDVIERYKQLLITEGSKVYKKHEE